jgi:hypothetical protein
VWETANVPRCVGIGNSRTLVPTLRSSKVLPGFVFWNMDWMMFYKVSMTELTRLQSVGLLSQIYGAPDTPQLRLSVREGRTPEGLADWEPIDRMWSSRRIQPPRRKSTTIISQ